jgi:hypothetical protein
MTVTGRKLDYAFGAVLTNAAEVNALDRLTFGGSTCIRIPRSILSALVIDIDDIAMRPIPDEVNTLNLLIGYANALPTDAPLASPPGLRHLIVSQVTDLVALTLGDRLHALAGPPFGGASRDSIQSETCSKSQWKPAAIPTIWPSWPLKPWCANASHGSPSLRPPLIQTTRARPADHLMNGSTPAGNVARQLSWL